MSPALATPVNEVKIGDYGKLVIVEECVVCGETHRHGANDVALARGERSSRMAHCSGRHHGYDLVLADDADPPACWRRRLQGGDGIDV